MITTTRKRRQKENQKAGMNVICLAKYPIPSTAFSEPSMPDKHPTDISSFCPPKKPLRNANRI
jgi:hypothetical protein